MSHKPEPTVLASYGAACLLRLLVAVCLVGGSGLALNCRVCHSVGNYQECLRNTTANCTVSMVNTTHRFLASANPTLRNVIVPKGSPQFQCFQVNYTDNAAKKWTYEMGCTFASTKFCSGWRKDTKCHTSTANWPPVTARPVTKRPAPTTPVTARPVTKKPVPTTPVTARPVTKKPASTTSVTARPVTKKPAPTTPVTAHPVTKRPAPTPPAIVHLVPDKPTPTPRMTSLGVQLVIQSQNTHGVPQGSPPPPVSGSSFVVVHHKSSAGSVEFSTLLCTIIGVSVVGKLFTR